MKSILVALTLAAMAAAPLVGAFHADDKPLLASGSSGTAGWASYKIVAANTAEVAADVIINNPALPDQAGGYLYDGANALIFGFTFTALASENGILVDVMGTGVDDLDPRIGAGFMGLGLTSNLAPGTYKLLLWAAGPMSDWTHAVRGDAGVSVAGSDSGSEAFLASSVDFQGAAQVQAWQGGLGARANVLGDYAFTVPGANTLIAVYFPVFASVDRTSVTTPTGDVACPCFFSDFAGAGARGPGAYTFHLTGAGGGLGGLSDVVLGGVGARLPA